VKPLLIEKNLHQSAKGYGINASKSGSSVVA